MNETSCDDIRLGGWRVLLGSKIAGTVDPYRQRRCRDKEGGGVLLGEVGDGVLLVTQASLPTAYDKRSRRHFVRHKRSAQEAIDRAHAESHGRWTYLGEWHTHPAQVATPSGQDRRMIQDQLGTNDVPTGVLLLLIMGTRRDFLGLWDGRALHSIGCSVTSRPDAS